jgi:hypothetical protein
VFVFLLSIVERQTGKILNICMLPVLDLCQVTNSLITISDRLFGVRVTTFIAPPESHFLSYSDNRKGYIGEVGLPAWYVPTAVKLAKRGLI